MSNAVLLKSFAKLNLFLKILGKRNDGYHEIESLFQSIDFCDHLRIETIDFNKDVVYFSTDKVHPEKSTVKKALLEVRNLTRQKGKDFPNVKIEVKKNIPIGSGLGGGSSNAAAVIIGLNDIFNIGLSQKEMLEVASKVGSDVPFFIYGGLCVVRGRGDIVQPLDIDFDAEFAITIPNVAIYSGQAYKAWEETERTDNNFFSLEEAINQIKKSNLNKEHLFYNSFEKIILSSYPEVRKVFNEFEKSGLEPVLSGSGSAVYAVLRKDSDKEKIVFELGKKGFNIIFAKTVKPGVAEISQK
ncbi:MAG: 4-(cytidine 5'-diphospho)-2-C-methyl-D-erythritol kinase [Actinobacteria bacterium]|nr:4-(cytidine 5'-diphospho)-2-C-methyl-D-erythritol kinase [Actinomycetota bacterium]